MFRHFKIKIGRKERKGGRERGGRRGAPPEQDQNP
jgi:hypothetical protein